MSVMPSVTVNPHSNTFKAKSPPLTTSYFSSLNPLTSSTLNICRELLQVFSYSVYVEDSWDNLAISILSQIVRNCLENFVEKESFACPAIELCLAYSFKVYHIAATVTPEHPNWEDAVSPLFTTAKTLLSRFKPGKQIKSLLAFVLIGYQCIRGASTASSLLKRYVEDRSKLDDNGILNLRTILGACLNAIVSLTKDYIKGIILSLRKIWSRHPTRLWKQWWLLREPFLILTFGINFIVFLLKIFLLLHVKDKMKWFLGVKTQAYCMAGVVACDFPRYGFPWNKCQQRIIRVAQLEQLCIYPNTIFRMWYLRSMNSWASLLSPGENDAVTKSARWSLMWHFPCGTIQVAF